MTENTAELLTPREAADMLRVQPLTLARWGKAGKLPCVRTVGNHRRYRREDIERLLEPRP